MNVWSPTRSAILWAIQFRTLSLSNLPDRGPCTLSSACVAPLRPAVECMAKARRCLALRCGTDIIAGNSYLRSITLAGQERMTHEITKLQAVEQHVLYKNSDG
jgi:hypothetical protein